MESLVSLAVAFAPVHATAFGHGKNTKFDAASQGGNWTCFASSASGLCGAATTHFFDAVGNGSTDNSTALSNWITYCAANGTTQTNLYIPPGTYHFASNNDWVSAAAGFDASPACLNAYIWAYGAITDSGGIQSGNVAQDNQHSARIATVSAGVCSVTVTDGHVSRFSAGNVMAVTGLTTQSQGYPPNFQWVEYVDVTGVSGNTVSFTPCLQNTYKSTWPLYDAGSVSTIDYGGPATIYRVSTAWNLTFTLRGMTLQLPNCGSSEFTLSGRTITLQDVTLVCGAGISPSTTQTTTILNYHSSSGGTGMEVDKMMDTLVLSGVNDTINFQSAVPSSLALRNFYGKMAGSPRNAVIGYSKFPAVQAGTALTPSANCHGYSDSVAIDHATIASGSSVNCFALSASYSYSSGVLSIADASVNLDTPWGYPGYKYFLGAAFGSTTCNAGYTFTISDVTQGGGNTSYATTSWTHNGSPIATPASLPNPATTQCDAGNGPQNYDRFVNYAALAITQTASTGTDMTQFAAPP